MKLILGSNWGPEEYFHNEFLSTLYKQEGGYQNKASDSGNYSGGKLIGTNHGISAPVLKTYLGRTPTVDEMKNLTKETATKIYKKIFWTVTRAPEMEDKYVAVQYADMYVNGGKNAVKIMKRALNNLGSQLSVSYSVKENFIDEVNNNDSKTLHEEFKKERMGKRLD